MAHADPQERGHFANTEERDLPVPLMFCRPRDLFLEASLDVLNGRSGTYNDSCIAKRRPNRNSGSTSSMTRSGETTFWPTPGPCHERIVAHPAWTA